MLMFFILFLASVALAYIGVQTMNMILTAVGAIAALFFAFGMLVSPLLDAGYDCEDSSYSSC